MRWSGCPAWKVGWGGRGCWCPGSTAAATHACRPCTTKLAPCKPLPSCNAALSALRALDVSGNRLTSATLLAAHLPACGARLTALRLGGNRLEDVASWMGPLPSLLHLDVSGNEVESLDGLAAAAPLLQVGWL